MAGTVCRAIDSCIRQAPLLIIDDGSTDGTYNILTKRYSPNSLRIIRLKHNHGLANAMNIAISEIDSDFFIMCSADDYVDKDYIKNWYKRDLSDVNYCNGGGMIPVPPDDIRANIIKNIWSDKVRHCHQFYTDTGRHIVDGTGCLCLKTSVVKKEKYDTNLINKEGGELLIRLALLGYEFRYFNFTGGYRDRIGKSSNTRANDIAISYIKKKLRDLNIPR